MHKLKGLRPSTTTWLFVLMLFAFLPRLAAFQYNTLPHGDIHLDYAAAWGLLEEGALFLPLITHHSYLEAQLEAGYPLDQHAPVWPVLGALGAGLTGDIYLAFKAISLLAGWLIILLSFFFFRKSFDETSAWIAATCIAISYLLIDYSGNGSLYSLHALLFLMILLIFRSDRGLNCAWAGILSGLAYLLNYQAGIIFPAVILVFLSSLRKEERRRPLLLHLVIYLGSALMILLPWFIRNFQLFGSALFSTNSDYLLQNLGVASRILLVDGHLLQQWDWQNFQLLNGFGNVAAWLVRNLGYFILRILVLAPLLSFFTFSGWRAWYKQVKSKPSNETHLLFMLLLLLHLFISIAWPVFKFRYFVPLLPLWIGLGAYGLSTALRGSLWFKTALAATIVCFLLVGTVTYLRVPSHTNYYDSNEFFHYRVGETEWWAEELRLKQAVELVQDQTGGTVIAPLEAFYHLGRPVLTGASLQDPAITQSMIDKHQVRWIIDRLERHDFYAGFLQLDRVVENETYEVLKIK